MAISESIVGVIAFFAFLPLALILFLVFRRRANRNKVWAEIDCSDGKTRWVHVEPIERGRILRTKWGDYWAVQGASTLYNGSRIMTDWKPLFRYTQGDPRPLRVSAKFVVSANPGKAEEVHFLGHQVIPAETMQVFLKQHLFADAYSGRGGLILAILIGLGIVAVLVIGSYFKK